MLLVTAYDGSDHGNAALVRADDLAQCLDAEHHVILVAHVQSYQWTAMSNPYQIDLYALEEEHLSEAYEKAKAILTKEPTVVMRRGEPAREIIAYAEEVGADFIVMGSRGRGSVKALFLGSTSHNVIHGAPCDVIVVRHPH